MTTGPYFNHFTVSTKAQLRSAILAGAYPTYEEARGNPFTVYLDGTNLKLLFPKGLHESEANKIVRNITRIRASVFQPLQKEMARP